MPYQPFALARTTAFDPVAMVPTLRTLLADATAGYGFTGATSVTVKKATLWTAPQVTACLQALETAPAFDPNVAEVDQKILTAVAMGLWECIPAPTMTKPQLRARILQIRSGL